MFLPARSNVTERRARTGRIIVGRAQNRGIFPAVEAQKHHAAGADHASELAQEGACARGLEVTERGTREERYPPPLGQRLVVEPSEVIAALADLQARYERAQSESASTQRVLGHVDAHKDPAGEVSEERSRLRA
jgi:hypothetical protein